MHRCPPLSTGDEPRHLALVAPTETAPLRLTRAQVASRLGVSISTVRRYEGVRLHPEVDASDVRWFQANEVAALAPSLANEPGVRNGNRAPAAPKAEARSPGELAALVFERLEQRQSLAEIVIGRVSSPTLSAHCSTRGASASRKPSCSRRANLTCRGTPTFHV